MLRSRRSAIFQRVIFGIVLLLTTAPLFAATYKIQPGDTIPAIARRFAVTPAALLACNSSLDPDILYVGQQLLVPENAILPATTTAVKVTVKPRSQPATTPQPAIATSPPSKSVIPTLPVKPASPALQPLPLPAMAHVPAVQPQPERAVSVTAKPVIKPLPIQPAALRSDSHLLLPATTPKPLVTTVPAHPAVITATSPKLVIARQPAKAPGVPPESASVSPPLPSMTAIISSNPFIQPLPVLMARLAPLPTFPLQPSFAAPSRPLPAVQPIATVVPPPTAVVETPATDEEQSPPTATERRQPARRFSRHAVLNERAEWLALQNASSGSRIVAIARLYTGTRYRRGGLSSRGMDCSGLVVRVMALEGLDLPHHAATLYKLGKPVRNSALQPGDLLFFRGSARGGISHVAIWIGDNKFIHASSSHRGVTEDSLSGYYAKRFAGARRLSR